MRLFFTVCAFVTATTGMGIEFFSEEDVERHLRAEKAIGVSKYEVIGLIKDTRCESTAASRSARFYVVKISNTDVGLYGTTSALTDLKFCTGL